MAQIIRFRTKAEAGKAETIDKETTGNETIDTETTGKPEMTDKEKRLAELRTPPPDWTGEWPETCIAPPWLGEKERREYIGLILGPPPFMPVKSQIRGRGPAGTES